MPCGCGENTAQGMSSRWIPSCGTTRRTSRTLKCLPRRRTRGSGRRWASRATIRQRERPRVSSTADVQTGMPPVYRIFIAALVMDLAIAVIGLGVQLLGNDLGASPSMLGWLGTVGALCYAIGCLFSGRLSDRIGRRVCVSLSCTICGLAWLTMTQAGSALQLLAILPFSGAGISMFWPPVQAWMSEITVGGRKRLNQNIGAFNISWTIGLMLGPVVAGLAWDIDEYLPALTDAVQQAGIARELGRYAPFLLAAICAVGVLALVQSIPREVPGGGEPAPEDKDFVAPHSNIASRFLHLAWIANFASWFGRALNIVIFTKIATEMGLSGSLIGVIIAMFLAGQLLMFLYLRNRSGWQYRLWPLLTALGVAAVAWVVAWFAQSPLVFGVAFAVAGMGAGVTYVSSLYYSLEGQSVSRGARAGIHEAVLGSGVFLGPL
ncbi:MAG: MFS transporter, partial [Armatimonadia bacterium]|nr:MFS transporter [Armatimonadia bacterium]